MNSETTPDTQPGFRGRLLLIGIGVTLFAIGQSLLFTIVSPLARRIGLSEIQFGAILTCASLPLIGGAPFWGKRSDRVGRKPVFVFGLLGSGVGTVLVALALQARLSGWFSIPQLIGGFFVARALYSFATSAIYPAAGGYIADVTDFRTRGQGMAVLGASNSLGAIIGPGMAAAFALAFTNELIAMYVAAVLMGLGAVAAVFMLQEPTKHHTPRPEGATTLKVSDARLRPFMLIWGAFFLTFSSVQITTAFLIQDRFHLNEYHEIVKITTLCLISMASVITVVQGLVFQLIRVTPQFALRLCGPSFCAALLTMLFAPAPRVLLIGFALLGLAFACATPGINGGASLLMEPHEQGAASGYLSAANTAGAILGPLVGTSLYRLNHAGVLTCGAILFALVSLYALTIRMPRRAETATR